LSAPLTIEPRSGHGDPEPGGSRRALLRSHADAMSSLIRSTVGDMKRKTGSVTLSRPCQLSRFVANCIVYLAYSRRRIKIHSGFEIGGLAAAHQAIASGAGFALMQWVATTSCTLTRTSLYGPKVGGHAFIGSLRLIGWDSSLPLALLHFVAVDTR